MDIHQILKYEIIVDSDELYILIVAMNKALANGGVYNEIRKPRAETLLNQLECMADLEEK